MIKQDTLENQAKLIYIGIGSNLGNKIKNIEKAKALLTLNGLKIIKVSSYYKTLSWPDIKKPIFLNIMIQLNTNLHPIQLLDIFQKIEKQIGRKKGKKNSPRVCDIDIISYGNIKLTGNISIPHKRMHQRNFVLIPLYELNKEWIHPKLKINIKNLIFSLPIKDIRSIKKL